MLLVFGAKEPPIIIIIIIIIIITNYKYDTSYKPLVMYSFITQTFQIFIPKIMQPLLHNKNDSPTPPPQRRVGRGGGHRIHSDGDDGRRSGVLKFNDF